MITVLGTVYRVIYKSPQEDYCIFIVRDYQEDTHTCTGNIAPPKVGEEVEIKGKFVIHKRYGKQIAVQSIQRVMPDTLAGARRYLESLGVKGLGPKSLEKLLDYFGISILEILKKENPIEILEAPISSRKTKQELYKVLLGEGVLQEINDFFAKYNMSNRWSRQLYEIYGAKTIEMLQDNPYYLLTVDTNLPFHVVDHFAEELGFPFDNPKRIDAGIRFTMEQIGASGHSCMPIEELMVQLSNLLGDDYIDVTVDRLERLIETKRYVQ